MEGLGKNKYIQKNPQRWPVHFWKDLVIKLSFPGAGIPAESVPAVWQSQAL